MTVDVLLSAVVGRGLLMFNETVQGLDDFAVHRLARLFNSMAMDVGESHKLLCSLAVQEMS